MRTCAGVVFGLLSSERGGGVKGRGLAPPSRRSKPQALLGCFEEQMCKALLMENVEWQPLPPALGVAAAAEGESDLARRVNSR